MRRLGDATGLVEVGDRRPTGVDGAEAAVPRADTAQDHEGGGPEGPAFALVRASSFLADRVQRLGAQDAIRVRVRAAHAEPDLEPCGASTAGSGVLGDGVPGRQEAAIDLGAAGIHHVGWRRMPAGRRGHDGQLTEGREVGARVIKGHCQSLPKGAPVCLPCVEHGRRTNVPGGTAPDRTLGFGMQWCAHAPQYVVAGTPMADEHVPGLLSRQCRSLTEQAIPAGAIPHRFRAARAPGSLPPFWRLSRCRGPGQLARHCCTGHSQ